MKTNKLATTTWHKSAIALTGSSGTGKSTASEIFRELGATVISADNLARQATAPGSPTLKRITEEFGENYVLADGTLNRRKLANTIFTDPDKKSLLESILHPKIAELAQEEFQQRYAPQLQKTAETHLPPYPVVHAPVVYDCPLLFESNVAGDTPFFKTILITADPTIALKRIMERDGISETEAESRIANQMPQHEKARLSDIVIDNSESIDVLRAKLNRTWRQIVDAYASSS